MSPPTKAQIDKLPKWAQEHIDSIQRQRDKAVLTLNEFQDQQTIQPIWYEAYPCIGEGYEGKGPSLKRCYIHTTCIEIKHAGVYCSVYLTREDDSQRPFGIEITATADRQWSTIPAMFNPRSNGQMMIMNPKNARK